MDSIIAYGRRWGNGKGGREALHNFPIFCQSALARPARRCYTISKENKKCGSHRVRQHPATCAGADTTIHSGITPRRTLIIEDTAFEYKLSGRYSLSFSRRYALAFSHTPLSCESPCMDGFFAAPARIFVFRRCGKGRPSAALLPRSLENIPHKSNGIKSRG